MGKSCALAVSSVPLRAPTIVLEGKLSYPSAESSVGPLAWRKYTGSNLLDRGCENGWPGVLP